MVNTGGSSSSSMSELIKFVNNELGSENSIQRRPMNLGD